MFHKTYPQITQIPQKAESTTSAKSIRQSPYFGFLSAALCANLCGLCG
jgi:hypothetical protein